MSNTQSSSIEEQIRSVGRNLPLQSCIYSAVRRAFFLGRRRILRELPFPIEKPVTILEVGCGAGHNLQQLVRWFPNALVIGIDRSAHKLSRANKVTGEFWNRVELLQEPFLAGSARFKGKLDAVLFSYSLSVSGSQWQELVYTAQESLKPGGFIAVTDFHNSRFSWFKAQMANHKVRMDGRLLPLLNKEFDCLAGETRTAYGGLWEYFQFLGRKG